jgi:hypothetical protein
MRLRPHAGVPHGNSEGCRGREDGEALGVGGRRCGFFFASSAGEERIWVPDLSTLCDLNLQMHLAFRLLLLEIVLKEQ